MAAIPGMPIFGLIDTGEIRNYSVYTECPIQSTIDPVAVVNVIKVI